MAPTVMSREFAGEIGVVTGDRYTPLTFFRNLKNKGLVRALKADLERTFHLDTNESEGTAFKQAYLKGALISLTALNIALLPQTYGAVEHLRNCDSNSVQPSYDSE